MADIEDLNRSELGMADALAQEFRVISNTEEDYTILDYIAVARVMHEDGSVAFRTTHRADSTLPDQLGMLAYGIELVKLRLRSYWGA